MTAPRGVIRWLDADNAGPLGYLKEPGSHRYLDGQWILEFVNDGATKWMGDLDGARTDVAGAIRAAEVRLGVTAGQSWTPVLNGYGDAYTTDLPALPTAPVADVRPTSSAWTSTAFICGLVALFFFPPVLGIAGIIFGAIGLGRGEKAAGAMIAWCIVAMLAGMAFGIYTTTGYWPWQTVYYYR